MNIVQLRYVVAAIECRSFAAASKQLHVSSQTISHAVSELEEELGMRFFDRTAKSALPTDSALKFASAANAVLWDFDKLSKFGDDTVPRDFLRIGWGDSYYRGSAAVDKLISSGEEQLGFSIEVVQSSGPSCVEAVQSGFFDAAIVPGSGVFERVESRMLALGTACVLTRVDNCQLFQDGMNLRDIAQFPVASPVDLALADSFVRRLFLSRGIVLRYSHLDPSRESYEKFLRSGGVMLVNPGSRLIGALDYCDTVPVASCDSFSIPYQFLCRPGEMNDRLKALFQFSRSALFSADSH